MRILFLNHNLKGKGTYFRAQVMAREMVRRGHEARLITVSPEHWYRAARFQADGVEITETPCWNPAINPDDGWGPLDVLYRLGRVLADSFDLLYAFAHPPNVYLPAALARALRRKPVVVDWCDVYRDGIFPLREEIRAYTGAKDNWRLRTQRWAEKIETRMERGILRRADGVTVISKFLEKAALKEGVPRDQLLRYPGGANIDNLSPLDKAQCRRELGIEGPGPILGYVANYNPDERFFLQALRGVFNRFPQGRLITAAPPFTESLVEEQGLATNLHYLGMMPFSRLNPVLCAADVLLVPLANNTSIRGRWPHKFGDYLAAGRPIVANAVGDIADYLPPPGEAREESAGLSAKCTPEAFTSAIVQILERPERWEAMGRAARSLAEGSLNWSALANSVEPFLRRIAGK